ncbi:hypothetical protein N658DRAFT_69679 [Parathielavia hyrcaniae]|uniref:Uncharacterized protein n=1 Tax=Parathielavia hyrcaniae TaxID=113614 RepID=A0AAN6Q2V2_9PEZI|nr:hypothetical protein N658DRAFT_69679 [Parathielavia hyrcaniae]
MSHPLDSENSPGLPRPLAESQGNAFQTVDFHGAAGCMNRNTSEPGAKRIAKANERQPPELASDWMSPFYLPHYARPFQAEVIWLGWRKSNHSALRRSTQRPRAIRQATRAPRTQSRHRGKTSPSFLQLPHSPPWLAARVPFHSHRSRDRRLSVSSCTGRRHRDRAGADCWRHREPACENFSRRALYGTRIPVPF